MTSQTLSETLGNTQPLIEFVDIRKTYHAGTSAAVEVLRGLSLTIGAGEFVAIMGQSGSGKSTLMNILGLLDQPTTGSYRFMGRDISLLGRDDLAALRREAFGFVFQQYNLIPTISAAENAAVPAAYAGQSIDARTDRANGLLTALGLGDRLTHRPSELSGGQQQRVSIARALINGGRVILADEPTGALDSASGAQVMGLLIALARAGHTVILITHDASIANAAERIIEIHDGVIVSERPGNANTTTEVSEWTAGHAETLSAPRQLAARSFLTDIREAFRSGGRALLASPIRTTLTLLGIIIGVASVIALLAIGQGAKDSILTQLSIYGANRLYVTPGGENSRGPGGRLLESDVSLLRGLPNIAAAMPYLKGGVTVRAGNVDYATSAVAATTDFPRVLNWDVEDGVFFTKADDRSLAAVAVIGSKLRDVLFPDGSNPVGRGIIVNNVSFQVIGVLSSKGALNSESNDDDTMVIPFSTGSLRVFGKRELNWISVLIDDLDLSKQSEEVITATLQAAHRTRDFRVINKAASIEAQNKTMDMLTLLLGGTAAISLFVGGIGVMNVMLMTVTERTREIGIRMATGARTRDILRQFLTEAMMVSGAGGIIGVIVGVSIGVLAATVFRMPVIFSGLATVVAVLCAVLTGLVFGFMPALRAARLEPVAALARE